MFTVETVDQPIRWDETLATLPAAHVLQSWPWGDFKARWGWDVTRLLWQADGQPIAAAQVLSRPLPASPWRFLYVSKGPALDWANPSLAARVLTDLESYSRRQGAIFIKIDPDVSLQYGEPEEGRPSVAGRVVQTLLQKRGWQFSPEQIQFKNTVLIDLQGQPDEWLARMKSKWRYNIRLAGRRGVTVRSGTPADIPLLYRMYNETAARDGFLIRPEAYYADVWQQFMSAGRATLLLAEVEGEAVAGLLLFTFGRRAWYLYGASTEQHRNLMPNHRLQWAAMQQAKEQGCTSYDLWGAPTRFDEQDELWGVYRFKRGFGGQTVIGLGAYDFPSRPELYRLFTRLMPQARSLLRRIRGV